MSASPFSDRSPVLVFFHSGPPLHDLLSFPTRRSSDLIFSRTADHLIAAGDALRRLLARFARPEHRPDVVIARSEEHTSELQSRGQLVCRLLLEKQKMNSRNNEETIMNTERSKSCSAIE